LIKKLKANTLAQNCANSAWHLSLITLTTSKI